MNQNEMLEMALTMFKEGDYAGLQRVFGNSPLDDRQKSFEHYITKGFYCDDNILPCHYGNVDGKQVFTNYFSIFVMNKPFTIDEAFLDKLDDNTSQYHFKPMLARPDHLNALLKSIKECAEGENVAITSDDIKTSIHIIETSKGVVSIDPTHLLDIFALLGDDIKFTIYHDKHHLMGETTYGTGHILNLSLAKTIW